MADLSALPPRRSPVALADMPTDAARIHYRVRFSDCDPAGIGYTASLVNIMVGVLEDFFVDVLNIKYHAYLRDLGIGMGYAKVDTDFLAPVMMGDELDVVVMLQHLGGASAVWRLHAFRGETPVFIGVFVQVTTDLRIHKAIPIPAEVRAVMEQYEARCA